MSKIYLQPLYHAALPEFVQYAKAEGYNLEVATFAYRNVHDMDWETALTEHKQRLKEFPGKISFHGVFQDVAVHSSDPKIAETSKERILESVRCAQEVGAEKVVFHGNLNPLVINDYYRKNWLDRNAIFWQQVLDGYSGTVILENVWESDPDIFRLLLDLVASKRLKICFDIGHASVYSKAGFGRWAEILGADLAYMHFSDNDGKVDQHLQVGAGKIDWTQFTNLLRENGLEPDAVLETGTLDKTKASLAYMKKHAVYPF